MIQNLTRVPNTSLFHSASAREERLITFCHCNVGTQLLPGNLSLLQLALKAIFSQILSYHFGAFLLWLCFVSNRTRCVGIEPNVVQFQTTLITTLHCFSMSNGKKHKIIPLVMQLFHDFCQDRDACLSMFQFKSVHKIFNLLGHKLQSCVGGKVIWSNFRLTSPLLYIAFRC